MYLNKKKMRKVAAKAGTIQITVSLRENKIDTVVKMKKLVRHLMLFDCINHAT